MLSWLAEINLVPVTTGIEETQRLVHEKNHTSEHRKSNTHKNITRKQKNKKNTTKEIEEKSRHPDTKIKESESIPTLFHSYVKIKHYTLQQC